MVSDDERYLDILAVFHYVFAALFALFGLFPIIHLAVGIMMLTGRLDHQPHGPEALFGVIFVVVPLLFMAGLWALAVAMFLAGRRLAQRTRHTFCLVVAAIACIFFPIGTALGVFTIIVLMRPGMQERFAASTSDLDRPI
jgi:hypothetical protein